MNQVTVVARATDRAGNTGPDVRLDLTVKRDLPPTALLLAPASGQRVAAGAQLTVTARAQDDVGVVQVVVQASGAMTATSSRTVAPAALDTTVELALTIDPAAPQGGVIALVAAAADGKGQVSLSAPVTLTVDGDAAPPTVQMDQPANNALVAPGEAVPVVVRAADNRHVAAVSLQVMGAATFSAAEPIPPPAPTVARVFTFTVPSAAPAGAVISITATAADASGNQAMPAVLVLQSATCCRPP